VTSIISVLVIIGTFALAGWANAHSGEGPPVIEVQAHMDRVRETESGFYLPITVENTGGLTAQDVVVTGELDTGEGEPETADIIIAFLSGSEKETAEIIFTSDPNEGDFTIGPTSFVNP
jgi:uncharacterized protein (TIGR02588 family)